METFFAVLSILIALSSLILYIVFIGNYDADEEKRKIKSKYINDSKQNSNH